MIRHRSVCLVVCFATSLANAADYPERRAGLWEIQSSTTKKAGLAPVNQCIGPNTDSPSRHLERVVGRRGFCDLGPFTRQENVWIAESICRHKRKVVTSRKIATGNFQSHYRIDTIVRSRRGRRTRTLVEDVLEARYLGPCLEGQRAGDLITPGMGTLNMSDGKFTREPRRNRKPKTR